MHVFGYMLQNEKNMNQLGAGMIAKILQMNRGELNISIVCIS